MDLRNAFDTLDHSILINKLAYYGIHGTALKWFTSYITGRSQYVEIDGVSCNILPLSTGVPQGSILGPLLFLIYMNDIPNCTENFNFILYADDTPLNNTVQISSLSPVDINNELAKGYDWLAVNKLSLNVTKNKYVIFHAINKRIKWKCDSQLRNQWNTIRKSAKLELPWSCIKRKYVMETADKLLS